MEKIRIRIQNGKLRIRDPVLTSRIRNTDWKARQQQQQKMTDESKIIYVQFKICSMKQEYEEKTKLSYLTKLLLSK